MIGKYGLQLFCVVTILLGLTACATVQNYQLAVNSWQGASGAKLFRVWGYPDHTERLPNGHRLYVYATRDVGQYPIVTTPGYTSVYTSNGQTYVSSTPPMITGGGIYDFHCKTFFEVNSANHIVNTDFRGNSCAATQQFMQNMSNPRNYSANTRNYD